MRPIQKSGEIKNAAMVIHFAEQQRPWRCGNNIRGITVKKISVSAFIIIAASISGTAVNASDNEIIGLSEAISISLNSNNRYKIAREKVQEKEKKVQETWGALWPELSSGVSRTSWDAEKGALSTSKGETSIQLVNGTLSVNPGAFLGRLSSSREERIISVNEERRIKTETIVSSIELYYKVLLAADTVKLRDDSVKSLEENLRIVENSYKAGTLTKLVYLRAKVAAANEKTARINAERDFESMKARFNIQLGREIDTPVHLNEKSLMLESAGDLGLISVTGNERMNHFKEFVSLAIKNRPELMILQHKKELYKSTQAENSAVYMWPTLFANGSYGMSKLTDPVTNVSTGYPDPTFDAALNAVNKNLNPDGWNRTWSVSLGATYKWGSLSPLDASGARNDQLKSLSLQTDMEMEDFVRSVKLDIQDGLLNLDAASSSYLSQKENTASAEESFRVAALQFKNGLIDNTILLNANVELSSARTMYIQSLFEFQSAKARLNRSLGVDYFIF
jgi:outer membrane protein